MGKVVITFRVFPEDVDANLNEILENVKNIIKEYGGIFSKSDEIPIAFGLKALEISFLYPDKEFNEEEFLKKLKEIKGVSEAEIVSVSLSSF